MTMLWLAAEIIENIVENLEIPVNFKRKRFKTWVQQVKTQGT